jgi:hypothetical protein
MYEELIKEKIESMKSPSRKMLEKKDFDENKNMRNNSIF